MHKKCTTKQKIASFTIKLICVPLEDKIKIQIEKIIIWNAIYSFKVTAFFLLTSSYYSEKKLQREFLMARSQCLRIQHDLQYKKQKP